MFEAELARLAVNILANSWFANQVSKRALIESDGQSLSDSHGVELFKLEALTPDAAERVSQFFRAQKTTK